MPLELKSVLPKKIFAYYNYFHDIFGLRNDKRTAA